MAQRLNSGSCPVGNRTVGLKSIDGIGVKTLAPTSVADEFTVTLASPDPVLATYSVFFISAILTRTSAGA